MLYESLLIAALANAVLAHAGKSTGGAPTSATIVPLTQDYYPPTADCWEYRVPVHLASVEVTTFAFPEWNDDYQLQDFLTAATTRASANYPSVITGKENLTDVEYTIAASFCTPKNAATRKKTILLATHGIGLPRSHWNSAYEPKKYNFVQYAINEGYSVWFYDRLGTGKSDK